MSGAGVIADECPRLINQREQFRHGGRRRHLRLAGAQPPGTLVRVARNLRLNFFLAQTRREPLVTLQRPHADGLSGARVNQNRFAARHGGQGDFIAGRKLKVQLLCDDAPGFVAVRLGFGTRERLG